MSLSKLVMSETRWRNVVRLGCKILHRRGMPQPEAGDRNREFPHTNTTQSPKKNGENCEVLGSDVAQRRVRSLVTPGHLLKC